MSARIHIDLWSDIACPWCFIGMRRIRQAIEGREDVELQLRAYQLQPQLPPESVDAAGYLAQRFGGAERVGTMHARLQKLAESDGIVFDFARQKMANTRLAHRIVALAQREGQGVAAAEALFRGNFQEGADVARLEEALGLLSKHGVPLDVARLRVALEAGEANAEVDADLELAARYGISGVPFAVANQQVALEGAQPLEQMKEFIEYAGREAR